MSANGRKIFIVGNSRSGTTMLGRILGAHPAIHTFGELHFFEHQVSAAEFRDGSPWTEKRSMAVLERLLTSSREGFFSKVRGAHYTDCAREILSSLEAPSPVEVYAAFLDSETVRKGKRIPCEQTPRYLFFAKEILDAYPNALVVNLVRDPRDVLLSQKNKWRRHFLGARNIPLAEAFRSWANYHPYVISRLWVASVRAARRLENHERFVSLKFEELIGSPEVSVRSLCRLIGVDYEADMLNIPLVGSSMGQDRPSERGIDAGRAGSWRSGGLTPVELSICQRVCRSEMELVGYGAEPENSGQIDRWVSMSTFALKAGLVLGLNLGRTRHLGETLRRRLLS